MAININLEKNLRFFINKKNKLNKGIAFKIQTRVKMFFLNKCFK